MPTICQSEWSNPLTLPTTLDYTETSRSICYMSLNLFEEGNELYILWASKHSIDEVACLSPLCTVTTQNLEFEEAIASIRCVLGYGLIDIFESTVVLAIDMQQKC